MAIETLTCCPPDSYFWNAWSAAEQFALPPLRELEPFPDVRHLARAQDAFDLSPELEECLLPLGSGLPVAQYPCNTYKHP